MLLLIAFFWLKDLKIHIFYIKFVYFNLLLAVSVREAKEDVFELLLLRALWLSLPKL